MTAARSRMTPSWQHGESRQSGSPGFRSRRRGADAKPAGDDSPACAPVDGVRHNGCSVRDASEAGGTGGRRGDLGSQLRAVQELDRDQLAARWRQVHDRAPPPQVSRELMVRAICYAMQAEAYGGIDRQTQRRLAQLVVEMQSGNAPMEMPSRIKPGTRLIREWHSEIHEVLVLEEGFAFRGRVHRSLSAIAREITGTSWNGHAFFGLRRRGKRAAPTDNASGVAHARRKGHAVPERSHA